MLNGANTISEPMLKVPALGQLSQFGTNVVEVAALGTFNPFGDSDENTLTESDVGYVA